MVEASPVTLLALCRLPGVTGAQWQTIARQASSVAGLRRLTEGVVDEAGRSAVALRDALRAGLDGLEQASREVAELIERARSETGAELVTVLDEGYPLNLRRIYNLPPFLFVQGHLQEDDLRSVAVVGTRQASEQGLKRARSMARGLAERGVTVASGLAAGVDTAAHLATLDAGGRTLAIMGTGVHHTYPAASRELRERIIDGGGAVLSQFWPDQPPGRHTFPMRNVVTSGISQGTVVIEASKTSGAKMQARLAAEHGKRVFLITSLVETEEWAAELVRQRRAVAISSVDEVVALLATAAEARATYQFREQLSMELV